VSGAPLTVADQPPQAPCSRVWQISPGDKRRATVLRQVIEAGGVGAECGVYKGEFSTALLEHLAPRKLYLMDPWYLMTKEWHWGEGDRSTVSALCNILRAFEDDLVSGRLVLKIDDDLKALAELPDHHLDWAYVDSTHLYAPTVKELELLRRKVRPGGIIAGHDWQPDPAHRHHGVCKAVREAVERGSFELTLVDEPTIQWAVRLPGGKNLGGCDAKSTASPTIELANNRIVNNAIKEPQPDTTRNTPSAASPSTIDFVRSAQCVLNENVQKIKGWTFPTERQFNQWYATELYRGVGDIVDLGAMTGSSAAALACGLSSNSKATGRKVIAFDQFVKSWGRIPGEPLEDVTQGDDFLDRFLANTVPWKDTIDIRQGDVTEIGWGGEPIEYLFIDLMKSWGTAKVIVEQFFPCLIAPGSLVVQQDFFHHYTPWIHLIMYRLRDVLEPVFEIPDSCSYVFRTARAISRESCRSAVDFADITAEEIDNTFDYSESLVSKNPIAALKAAKAMFFYHYAHMQGRPGEADGQFDAWMCLAVREYQSIATNLHQDRNVQRTRQSLEPFMSNGVGAVRPPE
jgi:hypothetical protein